MNLLILPPSGGSYNSLRPEAEIYIGLAKAGYRVTILTNSNREYVPRFIEHGIQVIDCPPKRKLSWSTIRLIRQTIKQNNIDTVYATNSRTIPNAAFACIGTRVRLIVYRGTTGGLYRSDPSSYLSVLHPRVDGVICVSHAVEDYVRTRVWKRVIDNVVTIYKGHDLAWYNQPETDLTQFGTSKKNFNVACVANARPHKGLIYLIKAAGELADLKNLHIILVGEKISREPYVSQIEKSGMKERIHITGYRNDAPEIIAACDVLVLPSLREGLPRVILESLAYGTPVITSANQGSMEIIENNYNGLIVPLKDFNEIAEKIRKLTTEPELLENLSSHSREILEGKLSHKNTVKHYIDYFEASCREPRGFLSRLRGNFLHSPRQQVLNALHRLGFR